MKASTGVQTKVLTTMENSFIFKLLPHLMNDPHSLRPAYHLRSHRHHFEIVIGIPTVKRDKESYLLVTLMVRTKLVLLCTYSSFFCVCKLILLDTLYVDSFFLLLSYLLYSYLHYK